jgi:hypothetical protein
MGKRDVAPEKPGAEFRSDRVRGQIGQGKMIGAFFTKGQQVKGKSKVELVEATAAAKEKETEALDKTRIPRAMKGYVRDYFDQVRDTVQGPESDK